MRRRLNRGKTFFRLSAALLVAAGVFPAFAAPALAAFPEAPTSYTACLALREGHRPPRAVGAVSAAEGRLRLDVDLDAPGMFHVILRPDCNILYVVSDNLEAYVSVALREGGHSLDDLAVDLASSIMPFGMPMLSLRVERGEAQGETSWQGYAVRRTLMRFEAEFMGKVAGLDAVLWEHSGFAPLPLRVEEVRRDKGGGRVGDVVELVDIVPASFSEAERAALFEPPSGFTRYASILDLVLYALAS